MSLAASVGPAKTGRAERLGAAAPLAAAISVFLLTHPFTGVAGDARIYLGRALADLDPQGVGRDFIFALDGQSQFSLFTPVARAALSVLSLWPTAMVLTIAAIGLWIAAIVALARRLGGVQAAWIVIIVAVLPADYGPGGPFHFGEAIAVPRPFAEALVLFGLGAWLGRRVWVAWAFLVGALLVHPLMALPALAVATLLIAARGRAARWALGAGIASALGLALAGAPLFGRLLQYPDADMLALLRQRNGNLFPDLWPESAWALALVQASTVALTLRHAEARWRQILLASLAAGALGIGAAYVVGAYWHSLLGLQLQVWRMWWIVALAAPICLAQGLIAARGGRTFDRIVLALLALAWASPNGGDYAHAGLALLAVGADRWSLTARGRRAVDGLPKRSAFLAWICVVCIVAGQWLATIPVSSRLFDLWSSDFTPSLLRIAFVMVQEPLMLIATAGVLFGAAALRRIPLRIRVAGAGALLALAAGLWDAASTYERALGRGEVQPALREAAGPGEVLWLTGSLEPWVWMRQPHWAAVIQGAGTIFSPKQADLYRERAAFLNRHGFDAGLLLSPAHVAVSAPTPDGAAFAALCARSDAPAAIVLPLAPNYAPPEAWRTRLVWRAPAPRLDAPPSADGAFFRTDDYAVVRCADHR